ncbi:cytochrome P450 [Irpex rosettiformis]|uniref:Cytochrome P450 n=1 Tax=Irpex rosettiformis TaxID=378272 RepID=A0ACB8UEI4_9APHY|nr:cytochrome P450 [Irpex rosettiformis]
MYASSYLCSIMSIIISLLLALLLCAGTYWALTKKQRRTPSLPSPPGDPVLGHLRYMPSLNERDIIFHEWGRKYGDVFVMNILGKSIIVINSEKAANEIMEKRSAIYSDRPPIPLLERCGWKDGLVIAGYGPLWAAQRKMMQRPMSKATIMEYRDIQEREADLLMLGLLEQPQEYFKLLRRFTAGTLMAIIYGHRIRSLDDKHYKLAEDIDSLHPSVYPSLLDISPYFAYLPSWFPGAWFVDYIKETRPILLNMIRMPLERAWQEVLSDSVTMPSYASNHLRAASKDGKISEQDWWTIGMSSSQLITGGIDTSFQTLQWFIVCILLHPEVQVKAQCQIDEMVGRDRLPHFTDKDALPYVQCVVHEVMRWLPVVPLGIPHKSTSEDVYEGMRIPKGAIVMVNSRSLTWDENVFHEPRQFKPERFLPQPEGAGETFPANSVFGWGRRICPGRHLAEATIWLAIARILAVFTISKAKDANGNTIDPDIKWDTGLVRHPEPFLFDIVPRDDKASEFIKNLNLHD